MTEDEGMFAAEHEADFREAELAALGAEVGERLQEVKQHYSEVTARLRAQIASGAMTSDEAVSWLCRNYHLTRIGAEDILQRH